MYLQDMSKEQTRNNCKAARLGNFVWEGSMQAKAYDYSASCLCSRRKSKKLAQGLPLCEIFRYFTRSLVWQLNANQHARMTGLVGMSEDC